MPNRRRTSRLPRRGASTSAPLYTYRVLPCPEHPPGRQRAASWRRVVQETVALTPNTATPFNFSDFIVGKFNTTGFSSGIIHRVSVWTSANVKDTMPSLICVPDSPGNIATSGWSVQGVANYTTGRACTSYLVPPHLSGPFAPADRYVTITASGSSVTVELDVTFM